MSNIACEIISIGDELLIGQVMNTNASWIAEQLNLIGITVSRITTVGDTKEAILGATQSALENNSIVIITGGLGPTKDDLTKDTLAEYFQSELYFNEEVRDHLEKFFRSRGKELSESNRTQCYVPGKCKVLMNQTGTAPGMLFETDSKLLFSLPGVPSEMKQLMRDEILPLLKVRFPLFPIIHRTYSTEGIPESVLMVTLQDWENSLPASIKLAYLPSSGIVRLRLSSMNSDGMASERIDQYEKELVKLIGDEIFSYQDESLEEVIKNLLLQNSRTITTAESCTGGYIAHKLTSVPGMSKAYPGSVITYDYWVKTAFLGVKESTLKQFGAVSRETVTEMAASVREKMRTDYAIAVSGIAGPDGGTDEKPVGTVWIAWATPDTIIARKFQFSNHRAGNIQRTYQTSLNVLRKLIMKIDLKKSYWEI